MSQRVKRPNRSEDGSVPAKRRKRPTGTPSNTISAPPHHYNNSSSSSSLQGVGVGTDHNADHFLSTSTLGASAPSVDEEACSSKGGCPSKMAPPQSDGVQQQSWRHLHELKSIYNRTSGCEATAPAELFRKDLISAMKLPDSEPLSSDEYWVIVDQWKQEWERGVQVPVNPDSLPEPSVTVTHCGLGTVTGHDRDREGACGRWYSGGGSAEKDHQRCRDFKLPKNKYIRITPFDSSTTSTGASSSATIGSNVGCVPAYDPTLHHLSNAPQLADAACHYDLDDCDTAWLKLLNAERAASGAQPPITAEQLERVLERLEVRCWDRIQSVLRNEEGLGIEYDETVICDVCRSPDSEEGNEMVFCDSCNICVHQACYGITRIPDGQWLCCTCGLGRSRPECVLCPNKGGAMKSTKSGQKWAHVSCALWIPEVSIGCVEKMEPITKISSIPQSRWALICVLCRDRVGACIQCSVKTCKTAYHVTCAFKHGLEMRAIIEDENADDGVKLRSYCEKHSKSSKKEKSVCSSSEDDDCKRKKRKDMTSEEKNQARAQRSQEIEAEFYKHVSTKDIAVQIEVDADALQFIYNYWKLKRKAGHNKPLLPPKSEDNDILNHQQEQADLEKMKMFVQLRQDLERVRNLCYMVSRREKISRTFIRTREQTFYKQVNVIQSAQGSLPAAVFEAVLGANHAPSIYDILYSHDKADETTMDFSTILARIAGVKEEDGGHERKLDVNGLFRDVKNNPYKKLYFNGSSKRRSLYGSGLSSAGSSSDERPRANKENRLLLSSSEDDQRKFSVKKRHSVGRGKLTGDSSSEEESSKHHSGLKQIENELSVSNSDSDELILISSKSLNMKKAMKYIYSDSDSTDTSMMKNDDRSSNADSQQSSRLRTKAAMKDFSIKMAAEAANKANTTKCTTEVAIKSVPTKNNKAKTLPSNKRDTSAKKKSNSSCVPSDLIVPQRQAAKKASENLKTSKDRLVKDTQSVAALNVDAVDHMVDAEAKLAIVAVKGKVKGRPMRGDKGRVVDVVGKEELLAKVRDEVKGKKGVLRNEDELDKEIAVVYVPQRQAAKKAAEHIKSGLGNVKAQGISELCVEKDVSPKKDFASEIKCGKKEQEKVIVARIDSKRKSSSNSTSSSSKSSSSDSSTSSSSDSDNDDSTRTNGRPTSPPEPINKQRSSTCEVKDNWPFLDKAAKSAASSTTSSSSSDSDQSNRRRTNSGSLSPPAQPAHKRKTDHAHAHEKADHTADIQQQKGIAAHANQMARRDRQPIPSLPPDKSRQPTERRSPARAEPVPARWCAKTATARGAKDAKPTHHLPKGNGTAQKTTGDRLRHPHVRSGADADCRPIGSAEERFSAQEGSRKNTRGSRKCVGAAAEVLSAQCEGIGASAADEDAVGNDLEQEILERKADRVFKSRIAQIFTEKICDGLANSSPIQQQTHAVPSPVKSSPERPIKNISTSISDNAVPTEVTPLPSDHQLNTNTNEADLCDELEDNPFASKEEPIKQTSAISLFSPQLHKDQDLMADFDNILDDGFGIGKEYNTMKSCLSFNLGYAQNFKEDSKEDSARETLNLVEKLRLGLSKKSSGCDVDDSISVASSTNKENDRLDLCEQIVPNHSNVECAHGKEVASKVISDHDEMETYNKYSSCTDVGKSETTEDTHQTITAQVDESWVAPVGNYTDLNSIKSQFADTIPTIIEPFVSAQSFAQTAHEETPQQLDESMLKGAIVTPDRQITQTPFLDPTSMDYTSMDIHPNAKWAEKRVMPSRRSSSSSTASISSRTDAEEENVLYKRQDMIINHPIHPVNMDMGYGNFPPMEQQFAPFPQAPQFVSAPVSLFPSNAQLPFSSPNTPIFPPSFGVPYPQHSVIDSMPKPEDTLPFQTCTAAFTSSEHNMALTAAMVNIRKEPIIHEESIQTTQQDSDPQLPTINDETTNNTTPNHVEPSPNPSLKSNGSAGGKKSPNKPTRSSARFITQQQVKSPSKSPGKSPRQEGAKRGRGKGRGAHAQSLRGRGRGRSRGRGTGHFNSQLDYDFNTIHNKLVGTVYDLNFDDDMSKDNMADLRAMRERRRSIDVHERGVSSKEASESPKFQSPSQTYKNKSYNTDLRDLRPPSPIKEPIKVPTPEVAQVFPDIGQPVLPGPVDMRTYNSTFDTTNQSFAESNLVKFDSEPPAHIHDDYDYEFDKELQNTLTGGSVEKTTEPPPPEVSNIKVSLSDSRNQLKVKIKGPIANYTTNVVPPLAPVCETMISAKMDMNSLCNNTMTSSMVNSNSGTSSLRRMRKKELLRQYWTQDMNMDDPAGKAIGYPSMPSVTPSINRTIITIPKAVASMTTIPTRDDYRDYRTGSDEFVETKHRKEKSRLSLSRELKQLDLAMEMDDRRRNSLSMIASGTMVDGKRRGRPPRNTTGSSILQQMPAAPKLKIKIAGNNIIGAQKDIEQMDSAVDRIRPPKKRLSNITKPSVEELMRASLKFRRQVVADFGEKKKKRDKGEKRRDRKKKKRDKHNMQILSTGTDTPTKLILRIGKKVDGSFTKPSIAASDISININRNSSAIIKNSLLKVPPNNSSDIIKRIFPPDPLALPTPLPNVANTTTALRLVRANKVTPIKLKLSRCQKGSGYIMRNDSNSTTDPPKISQAIVTIESACVTYIPSPDNGHAAPSPQDNQSANQSEQGPVVPPPPASHTDPPAPSSPPPLSVTGPPIICCGGKAASVSVSVVSPVSLVALSDSCAPAVSASDGSSTIASAHIPLAAAAAATVAPALNPTDCEVR